MVVPVDHGAVGGARPDDEDRIVVVRPAVVEQVGHAFGNLFQRIYHLTDQLRERDAATVALLGSSIRQLEDFLQLVMDYFSPLPLTLESVPGTDVAQSLARQVSDAVGCPVRIDGRFSEGRLLVDPGRLARAFALLALQLRQAEGHERVEVKTVMRPASRSLVLTVHVPLPFVSSRSRETEMQWTVAEKVLESHGGALKQNSAASGEMTWEIVLPLQP